MRAKLPHAGTLHSGSVHEWQDGEVMMQITRRISSRKHAHDVLRREHATHRVSEKLGYGTMNSARGTSGLHSLDTVYDFEGGGTDLNRRCVSA